MACIPDETCPFQFFPAKTLVIGWGLAFGNQPPQGEVRSMVESLNGLGPCLLARLSKILDSSIWNATDYAPPLHVAELHAQSQDDDGSLRPIDWFIGGVAGNQAFVVGLLKGCPDPVDRSTLVTPPSLSETLVKMGEEYTYAQAALLLVSLSDAERCESWVDSWLSFGTYVKRACIVVGESPVEAIATAVARVVLPWQSLSSEPETPTGKVREP
jgi:hypothetical protein